MKKVIAIFVLLTLCLSVLSIGTFAVDYNYVTVTGTMNSWNASSAADRMTKVSDGVYTITYENMAAGSYEFKFTANGNWTDLDLGGAYMGSGVESSLSWGGGNIKFSLEEASDVTIDLDINNYKFTMTVGGQVSDGPSNIIIHISVPESWGGAYGYVWNPDSLGSWPGTMVENGVLELPAVFDGMVIHNNNGTQTADITNIDLTKEEVWVTVHDDKSVSLSYEDPNQGGGPVPGPEPSNIKIHVIAPDSWESVYGYSFNPELCGSWPGTMVENGVLVSVASFEGFIINNGSGAQTADITNIDLNKEEVWIVVAEDCTYALYYDEADVVIPAPIAKIKINVIAEHWSNIYAYSFSPEGAGAWPGSLVENGAVEIPANFGGLVLSNGDGQQTGDIMDIDLSKEEVWIVLDANNDYTLSYEAPVVDGPQQPETGDSILAVGIVLCMSAVCLVSLTAKKKEF